MKTMTLSLALAFFMMMTPVFAQHHDIDVETTEVDGKKIVKIHKGGDFFIDHLQLTDEQKKEFQKLDLQFEKETITLKNELELKQLEKKVELDAESPSLNTLNSLIDDIHKLEANMEKKRLSTEFKKRDLLTEEQQKKWRPMGNRIEEKIIMLKGHGDHDMLWMHDKDFDINFDEPSKKKIEKRIEIR